LAALAASRKITVETARSDAPSQFIAHLERIAPDVGTLERSVRRAGDSVKQPLAGLRPCLPWRKRRLWTQRRKRSHFAALWRIARRRVCGTACEKGPSTRGRTLPAPSRHKE